MLEAKDPVIFISESDSSTGDLTMSDGGWTDCDHNNHVFWIIMPNSGVKSITAISPKSGNPNVFVEGPSPVGSALPSNSVWKGKIDTEIDIPTTENYDIEWLDEDDNSHTYDPTIRVNT